MAQITGCIALALVSMMMASRYFKDKERFRIFKTVAIFDMVLALLCLVLYFIEH